MSIPMRMQQRRGTAAQWAASGVILNEGEIGYERGTGKFKVGDGVTQWNALEYAALSEEAVAAKIARLSALVTDLAGNPLEDGYVVIKVDTANGNEISDITWVEAV